MTPRCVPLTRALRRAAFGNGGLPGNKICHYWTILSDGAYITNSAYNAFSPRHQPNREVAPLVGTSDSRSFTHSTNNDSGNLSGC